MQSTCEDYTQAGPIGLCRTAHPTFVVPAVVEKADAAIDGVANDADAQSFVKLCEARMPTAQADGG
jgi:hypothetical protein